MTGAAGPRPAAPLSFSCDRALAPLLWAFAFIMAVELAFARPIVSAIVDL